MRFALRPLSIGEIVDRSVTLFLRNMTIIVLIWSVAESLDVLVGLALFPAGPRITNDLLALFLSRRSRRDDPSFVVRMARDAVMLAENHAMGLLASTATFIALDRIVTGFRPSLLRAYHQACSRWFRRPLFFVSFVAAKIVVGIMLWALSVGVEFAVIVPFSPLRSSMIPIVIPLVLLVAVALIVLPTIELVLVLANVAIAVGESSGWRAVARGVRRVFSAHLLWRNVLFGSLSVTLWMTGIVLLELVFSVTLHLARSHALYWVVTQAVSILPTGLFCTLMSVYATDVRVRREGYDLALAAAALPLGPRPHPSPVIGEIRPGSR